MLNLNDVYLFVRAVEHRGFAPAARSLGLPKSTVSKRVGELERALGVRLLQRSPRSFAVTEVGAAFYERATAMLIEAEAAENVVMGRLAEPTGTVRITASIPTAQLHLAPLLPEAARIWPKIRIDLHATDRFVDLVQENFDIGLRDHFGPLADSELVQRRMNDDPIHLVASPHYVAQHGRPQHPADLGDHAGILLKSNATVWTLHAADGNTVQASPPRRFAADESQVLLAAAVAGLGITCLPAKLCQAHIEAGTLTRILPEWTAGQVTTTLLMPHRRGQLPSVRAVVGFLAQRLSAASQAPAARSAMLTMS
jgi:DNA-binding transcriptional LysR family regulator